jgi:DNA-binding CsgD family transcriptional regulator/tetratricopeptide (TPR) repeat protein
MPATTALLERDAELATIEALLDAACSGSGQILTIEGEAGAGKTSLLGAAGRLAAASEMGVLRARGGEYERDFPYGVVRQLFEPMLLFDEVQRAELLTGSAALAAPVFDLQAARRGDTDPLAIQHGLYWLMADLAAASATVLLIDDAQWADLSSLRALAYAGRRLEGLPILVACTVRTGEPGQHEELLDQLRNQPTASLIEPAPLSVRAIGDLTAAEVGSRPSEQLASACREATAGNPFFLVELLRSLDGKQLDSPADDTGALVEKAAASISRSILSRLSKLGEHSVTVARAVAVLEPNAETRLIAELADLPLDSVAESCALLVRARLLSDSQPVTFAHPLAREAVLSEVPAPRRAADHAIAARILERDGAVADTVAAHLLLAEQRGDDWAVGALRTASAGALARGAPETAVRYLRRALQEPPGRADRPAVSRELGLALLRASDREGIEILRTVRAATEDPVSRAELAHEIATSLGLRGGGEEAAALLEESLAEIDPAGELGTLLRATLLLVVMWGLERLPSGDLPEPAGDVDSQSLPGRVLLAQVAAMNALGFGRVELGLTQARRSTPDVATVVADATAGLPHQGSFSAYALADRGDVVADLFEPSLEAARQRGAPLAVAGGHGVRAFARLFDGELAEAGGDADITMHILSGVPISSAIGVWSGAAIRIAVSRGDFATAEGLLTGPWSKQPPLTGIPAAIFLCARGELRRATGRLAEARHDYLAASERISWLPLANPEVFPWRTGSALCEAALGNDRKAREIAADALEAARAAGGTRGIGIALRVQGTVCSGEKAIGILREAVATLAGTRARLEHAHALAALGAALRRANQRREARAPLREALDIAHHSGAIPLEEQARTELEATGARPRKAVYSGVESLTPSELRVARIAAEGKTNREIAQALTVTEKTIETHMRHVFQKLDVGRRTELAGALEAD